MTPCTGQSAAPAQAGASLSSKVWWGITLSHTVRQLHNTGLSLVSGANTGLWLAERWWHKLWAGGKKEGEGRVEEGGGLLFVYLDKTPDLIIGSTRYCPYHRRHWISISQRYLLISHHSSIIIVDGNIKHKVSVWTQFREQNRHQVYLVSIVQTPDKTRPVTAGCAFVLYKLINKHCLKPHFAFYHKKFL